MATIDFCLNTNKLIYETKKNTNALFAFFVIETTLDMVNAYLIETS